MIDRKLLQQALDALELVTANMLDCRDQLAERGGRPTTNVVHQRLWDAAHKTYTDNAIPVAEAIRARLAQPEKEWVGLTDAEAMEIEDKSPDIRWAIIQAEAKLKEKNI